MTATLLFTAMATGVKVLGTRYPTGQLVFARAIFAVPLVLAGAWWSGRLAAAVRTRRAGMHATRAVLNGTGIYAWFSALTILTLPEVTALLYLTPIVTVLLAAWLLREVIPIARRVSIGIALVGLAFVVAPQVAGAGGRELALLGVGLCLVNSVTVALSLIQIRQLGETEAVEAIVLYLSLFTALGALLTLPYGWRWPDGADALLLAALGLCGGLGQILLTASYRHAPVAMLTPFEYTNLVWAMLIGYLAFGEVAAWPTVIGAVIVIFAALYALRREHAIARAGSDPPR